MNTKSTCVLVVLLACPLKSIDGITDRTFTLCRLEPQRIEEQILAVLIDSGFTMREQAIILAQSKHESGNYRNSISKHNNVFSLYKRRNSQYALQKKIKAEGCACFAAYNSIKEATLDYLQYRKHLKIPPDAPLETYVAHIKKMGYFQDNEKKYLNSLKQLITRDELLIQEFNTQYNCYRICRVDDSLNGCNR
jgi:hypothetical protein